MTTKKSSPAKPRDEKPKEKPKKYEALSEEDIKLLDAYSKDLYGKDIKKTRTDIDVIFKRVNSMAGIKQSNTGLSNPSMWDFKADGQLLKEQPLRVARCTTILPQTDVNPARYIIHIKQSHKYVTQLHDDVAPVDIKEGIRVGVDSKTYKIHLPLPMKINKAVSMMEVDEKPDITYNDIGGCRDQIKKLREVVELPLMQPKRFADLGLEPPRGALMTGPPGMGKTLCARAVANRTDACFIRVIGSELAQRYIGEGAQLVRDLFDYARTKKACIIFFDEIDAIGQNRLAGGEYGDNEAGRTLMELIVQLDGFDPRGNIKVLMATNRGDTLDPALLRPGRLDRKVEFGTPDYQARIEIFKIHARQMNCARDIRYELLARLCPAASGADIRSICTEAGMYAIRQRKKICTEREFLQAVDKVIRADKRFSALGRYLTHT